MTARSIGRTFSFYSHRMLIKVISLAVAISFLLPFLTWAFESPNYEVHHPGLVQVSGKALAIPSTMGTIVKAFSGGPKTIIHIQDLHCNYEVQMKIAKMIRYLAKTRHLNLVGEEGASYTVNTARISTFPDHEARRDVADYLVRQGKLTGAEYDAAVGDVPIRLEGIETPALYEAAHEQVSAFFNHQSQGYCYDLKDMLDQLKPLVYNRALKALDKKTMAYREGRLELVSYADVLLRQARRFHLEPVHGLLLQELANGKQGLDQDQVMDQLALLERRVREQLYTTAQQQELDQAYHRLDVIQKLLNISATPEELKDFRDHRQNFRVAAFLNFIQTTGGSTASSLTLDAAIYHLDQYLDQVGRFYDLADQRSSHFVHNLLAKMDRYHQSLAVMITGGFHTDKVLAELQGQGVTCISIKPRVIGQDVVNPYFALLQNQRLPLEKMLAQNQDILALATECPDLRGVDGHQVVAQQALGNRVRVAERFKELLLKARLLARLVKKNSTHWQEIPATMAAELKDYLANGTLTLDARQFLEDNVHLNNAGKPSLAVLPFKDGDQSINSVAILAPKLMAGQTQHELQRLRLGQTDYLFYSNAGRSLEALNALLKQQSQRPLHFLLPPGMHLKDFFGWSGALVDWIVRFIRWLDKDKPRQPLLDRIKPWVHSLPKMELTWMAAAGSPWLMPVVLMTASNGEKEETKGTGQSTQAQDKEDLIETLTRTIRLYPKELIHSRDLKLDSWDSKNYHFEEMDSNTGWGHWVSNHFPDLVLGTWEDVEKKYSYTHQKMIRHVVERFRNRNGSVVSFYYFDDHAYSVPYAMEAVARGEVPEKGNTQLFLDEHYDFADVPAMTRHFKVPQNLAEWLSNINQYIYMNNLNWIFSAAGFLKKHIWLYDTSSRNEPFRQSQETVKEEEKAVRDNRLKHVKSGFEHYFHYARRPRQQKIIVNIDTDVIGDMLGVGDVHYSARTRPYAALRYLSDFLRQLTLQDKNTVGTFHASTTFDQITYGDVEIVRFLARVAPVLLLLPKQENEQALTEAVHKVAEEHAPHVQVNLEQGVLTESKQEPMLFNIIHSLLAALGSAGLVLIPLLMGAPHWLGLAGWSMALVFALHGLTGHLIMGASMEKINTAWRNRIQRYFGPKVKIEYLNTAALHAKTEELLTASAAASDKPAVLSWWQWGLIPWTSAVTDVTGHTVYLHQGWVSDELGLGLKLLRLIMLPLTLVHEASALWLNDHLAVKAMPGWVQTVGRYMLRPLQMATLYPYWKLLIVKKRGLETASSAIDDKDLQTDKQDINAKIKAQWETMYAEHDHWSLNLNDWQTGQVAAGSDKTIHYITIPNPLRPEDKQYNITLEALTEEGNYPTYCKITAEDPFDGRKLEATFQLRRMAGQKKISISHLSRPLQSGVGTGVMFFLSQAMGKEQEPGWTFQVDRMMFKPILTLMRTFFKQIKIHGASVANRDFETYLESEFYNKALSGSPKSPDEIVRDQLADLDTIEGAVLERLGWKEKTAEKRQLADQFAGIMQYKNESDAMGRKNFRNIALARILAYFKMYYADHPEEKQEYVYEWVKLLNEQFKDLPRLVYNDLIGKLAEAAVGKAKNGNPFVDLNDLDFRIWSARNKASLRKIVSSLVMTFIVLGLMGTVAYGIWYVLTEDMVVQKLWHHLAEWGSWLTAAWAGTIKETSTANNHPDAMAGLVNAVSAMHFDQACSLRTSTWPKDKYGYPSITIPNPLRPDNHIFDITLTADVTSSGYPTFCNITAIAPLNGHLPIKATMTLKVDPEEQRVTIAFRGASLSHGTAEGVLAFLAKALKAEGHWQLQWNGLVFPRQAYLMHLLFKDITVNGHARQHDYSFETMPWSLLGGDKVEGYPAEEGMMAEQILQDNALLEAAVLSQLGLSQRPEAKQDQVEALVKKMLEAELDIEHGQQDFRRIGMARSLAWIMLYLEDHPSEKPSTIKGWELLIGHYFAGHPRQVFKRDIALMADVAAGSAAKDNPFAPLLVLNEKETAPTAKTSGPPEEETTALNKRPGAMGRFAVESITILEPQAPILTSEELAMLGGKDAPAATEEQVHSFPEIAVTGHMIKKQDQAEAAQDVKYHVPLRALLPAEKEMVVGVVNNLKLIAERKQDWFGDDEKVLRAMISQTEILLGNSQTKADVTNGLRGFYAMDKVKVVEGPKDAVFAALGLEKAVLLDKWLFDESSVLEAALVEALSSENIGFVGRILGNDRQEQLTQCLIRNRQVPPIVIKEEEEAIAALFSQKPIPTRRKPLKKKKTKLNKQERKARPSPKKVKKPKKRKVSSRSKTKKDRQALKNPKVNFLALTQKAFPYAGLDLAYQKSGNVMTNQSIRPRRPWILRHLPGLRLLYLAWSALTTKVVGHGPTKLTGRQTTDLAQVLGTRLLQQWPQDHFSTMDLLRHGQQHKLIEIRRLPEEIKWWTYLNLLRQGQCWQNLSQQDSKNQATYALVLPDQLCGQLAQDVAQGQTEGEAFELFDQIAAYAGQRYYHTLYHQRHQAQKVYAFMQNDKVIQTLLAGGDQDMVDQALELMARGQSKGGYELAQWGLSHMGQDAVRNKHLLKLLHQLPAKEQVRLPMPGNSDKEIKVPLFRTRLGRPYVYPGYETQPVFNQHPRRRPLQMLRAA